MNFKNLLSKLHEARENSEAFTRTGAAMAKDSAKSATSDVRAKDAARKRAERARQIPRERKSKQELIRDIIAVRTKDGSVQLIFKDSFDSSRHTRISEQELTLPEAKQLAGDPKFEQTRASILLLGDTKQKEPAKKEPTAKKEEEPKGQEGQAPAPVQEKPRKPRKLTPEEMMQSMSMMTPEQLTTVPPELRQQYFQSIRNPPTTTDFDHLSYEELSVKYGINTATDLPYNQQVLNALVFLAKTKAGASDQEIATYNALSPKAMEFNRGAFALARKILSQIGDQCLQTLVSNIELGMKSINSEGASDMQCGNYRFKISSGGEMSISTTAHDQTNKNFRGYLGTALTNALQQEISNPSQPKIAEVMDSVNQVQSGFSTSLVSNQALQAILANPEYVAQLQNTPIVSDSGENLGMILDQDGNLNPAASLENYQEQLSQFKKPLFNAFKASKNTEFSKNISNQLLKLVLRGDGLVDPTVSPTHLITINGIFPLSDPYFAEIASTSTLEGKPAKDTTTIDNISNYKPAAAEKMRSYKAIIEAKAPPEPSLEELLVPKDQVNVANILANSVINSYDFDFNASLLPGFKPKDLNAVEFNYVTVGGKTTKIPVERNEKIATKLIGEGCFFINDVLIEALTNNFVLSSLLKTNLITELEASVIQNGIVELLESSEAANVNLKTIYENINSRIDEEPERLNMLINVLSNFSEEYKRDYAMEYRNYHGKPKQRKQRAARTKAREIMIKKGIVKKGDGVDLDHKKPLRSGGSTKLNNIRKRNKSENRSDNGHKKGEKQNKDWK